MGLELRGGQGGGEGGGGGGGVAVGVVIIRVMVGVVAVPLPPLCKEESWNRGLHAWV